LVETGKYLEDPEEQDYYNKFRSKNP